MKQSGYILVLILFCTQHVYARWYDGWDDRPRTFTGGLAAGINFCQVDGDRYFGYRKPGIVAGGFAGIHFNERISAQMELLFSQKGSEGIAHVDLYPQGMLSSRCHIGLSYVELPVLLQYHYKSYVIEGGGSYAVLVRTNEWILEPQELYIDKEASRFNTTDISLVTGVGRNVYKQLGVQVRFRYSLLPIRPNERIPAGYGWGTKGQFNNLLTVRMSYTL